MQERKLDGNLGNPHYKPLRETTVSTTDPDAPVVRHGKFGGSGDSRPHYKHHRAVDDRSGVITAIETTPGDVDEPKRTTSLLDQYKAHTNHAATTVVADQQYGTNANYRGLQKRGVRTHMGRLFGAGHSNNKGIFEAERFSYDATANHYTCPAGQILYPRRRDPRRQATEYTTRKGVCVSCPMLARCTRSERGRTLMRHDDQELVGLARARASSPNSGETVCADCGVNKPKTGYRCDPKHQNPARSPAKPASRRIWDCFVGLSGPNRHLPRSSGTNHQNRE